MFSTAFVGRLFFVIKKKNSSKLYMLLYFVLKKIRIEDYVFKMIFVVNLLVNFETVT